MFEEHTLNSVSSKNYKKFSFEMTRTNTIFDERKIKAHKVLGYMADEICTFVYLYSVVSPKFGCKVIPSILITFL